MLLIDLNHTKVEVTKLKSDNTLSDVQSLSFGVPHGSILGPILYSFYVKDFEKIVVHLRIKAHTYVQLYTACNEKFDFSNLAICLQEIKDLTGRNCNKLNDQQLGCYVYLLKVTSPQPYLNELTGGQKLKVENCKKYLKFLSDKDFKIIIY